MWTAIRPFWRLTQVALPNAVSAAQRHTLEPFVAFFAPELCRTEGCHRELVIHFVKTPTFCNEAGLAGRLYWFPVATVMSYHTLGGCPKRKACSHGSGGQQSEVRVSPR